MKKIILFPEKCEISMSDRVVYKPSSFSLEFRCYFYFCQTGENNIIGGNGIRLVI